MREDHFEQLEKMFPKGFIILAVGQDGEIRMTMSNPDRVELIEEWRQVLMKAKA